MGKLAEMYRKNINDAYEAYKATGKSGEFGMYLWEHCNIKLEIEPDFNSILESDDVVCYHTMINLVG